MAGVFPGRVLGERGAVGDEADSTDDEDDAGPAVGGEVFVQPEAAEQGDYDVSEGRCGHDEGEIGPGEGGHVAGEEAYEEKDSGGDEGVEEGMPEKVKVLEVDGANLGHSAGEEGVAYRCGEHDGDEDGVLGGF